MQARIHYQSLLIGLIAGLGGGLFSLGGGTLTIPLMLYWLKLSEFEARGTALAAAFFPAALGTWLYQRAGQMDWLAVGLVAIPALVVTPFIGLWTERLSGRRLRQVFGAVVMGGAVFLILRDQLLGNWALEGPLRIAYLIGVGIVEGMIAGSVGVSGGPVLAPLLVLGLGMPQQLAQGCSLAARIPAVLSGSVENFRCGHVRFRLLPGLIAGGLLGAWLGSRLALALPELHLRSLFAVVLLLIGLRYLWNVKGN
jgi:uncharacterized membrane protein YfcA